MERVSVDTSFLIDLQRERKRRTAVRPAHQFLSVWPELRLAVSTVALGEFMEGFRDPHHPVVQNVTRSCELLPVNLAVAAMYAEVARRLRGEGNGIGANDTWIAATTLVHKLPLLTANTRHFERVPGLQLVRYRA